MRLNVFGRVSPLPGGLGARDAQIQLVVTRDAKVVSFNETAAAGDGQTALGAKCSSSRWA